MPAIVTPIRLDRVQQALFETVGEAISPATTHWGYTEPTADQLPINHVRFIMAGGPSPFNMKGKRGRAIEPISSVAITVSAVNVGKRYAIILNDFNYFHDAIGGDTFDTIRDALIADIQADFAETATATSGGSGIVTLTADFLGGIRSLSIVGALTAGTPALGNPVNVVDGTQMALVNIQAFSKNRELYQGAWDLIAKVYAALQTESLMEKFRRFGVASWGKTNATDLSALADAHWETRVSFDLTLAMRAAWVEPVDIVDTLDADITVKDELGATVEQTTVTVSL